MSENDNKNEKKIITRNLSWCSWDARQHQLNFIRRLSWSIFSNFGEHSLFKCASQPKPRKKLQKPLFSISRSFKVIDVGIPGKVVSNVCCGKQQSVYVNHSDARLVDGSRNRAFWRGYPNLMPLYGGLLEPRGSKLTLLKSTFHAENRQIDRQIASSRLALRAVARKNENYTVVIGYVKRSGRRHLCACI